MGLEAASEVGLAAAFEHSLLLPASGETSKLHLPLFLRCFLQLQTVP